MFVYISKTRMIKHFLPLFASQTEIPKQFGSNHQPEENTLTSIINKSGCLVKTKSFTTSESTALDDLKIAKRVFDIHQ